MPTTTQRIAALEQQLADAAAKEQAERDELRQRELTRAAQAELQRQGLDKRAAHVATGLLISDGAVALDDDDAPIFDDDGWERPLAEGLKSWLASDDGELFREQRQAAQSSDEQHHPELTGAQRSIAHHLGVPLGGRITSSKQARAAIHQYLLGGYEPPRRTA